MQIDALPRVLIQQGITVAMLDSIVAAELPVVIRGAIDHWPALTAGRHSPEQMNAYLKRMDVGALAPVMEAPASTGGWYFYTADLHEFNFSKRQARIGETLDRIASQLHQPQAPYVAIQMLPLATHLPEFVRQNPLSLLPSQITPRLWVGGRLRTQTHNDHEHNLACVVAGRRRFLLFPPEQVANLYVGPHDNPPPLSLVDPDQPDFERFPKFRQAWASASVATLTAGDAIFIPKYWWHHVASLDAYNVLVNYWWGDRAIGLERAHDCFLTALLALKDLPPRERAYWQAMFDSYVFRSHGEDALGHLPPSLQGALGPMNGSLRARLKQQLKMAYLKP